MPEQKSYILSIDREYASKRIAELGQTIVNMGPEFHEALTQSSETWHDNAPFDALREQQSVYSAEQQSLRQMLRSMATNIPKPRKGIAGIGSLVTVETDNGKTYRFLIAGDWTAYAGKQLYEATVISTQAPVAQVLLGHKIGSRVALPPRGIVATIKDIDQSLAS